MPRSVVASYCTTFLKPEMLHIFRQVTGLRRYETFVVCKERRCEDRYPFPEVEMAPAVRSNFLRRFWLKHVKREPPIVYRGEYGVLQRILERRRADLMHVYFGHTGVHLLPFIRRWPKPVVVSFHGADVMPRADRPGYAESLKALLTELPLVMARSESLAARLVDLGCDPSRIRLNRTGIPMERFPVVERGVRPADEGWRLVQACRLIEKKGLDVTLRAFARLLAGRPGSRLVLAGEGPMERRLRLLAEELGIAGQVRFAGFLDPDALFRLFAESDAFVHPSHLTADQNQEGVPNAMLEAMATGLPVLATRHGGIPEAVTEDRSGLLVAERDVDALAEAMRSLSSDPVLWRRLGEGAAAEVREKFEQGRQIDRLEEVYDELLQARGS